MIGAFKRLLTRKQETFEASDPDLDLGTPKPEEPVAVIGDVHGCATLLATLLEKLDTRGVDLIVTVGDYVDRGEDSARTLALLRTQSQQKPHRFICLMGNHEKMLLDFLDDPAERGQRWLRNGGLQTLASFGVGGMTEVSSAMSLIGARDALRKALPEGMENWLADLPLFWSSGNLWVVHAGADPVRPMTDQEPRTLLWGHRGFMSSPRQDGIWVAHGHTVTDLPEMRLSRIPTDTGAYFSGRLTAAIISPDGQVEFIEA